MEANQIYSHVSDMYSTHFLELLEFASLFCDSAGAYGQGAVMFLKQLHICLIRTSLYAYS
jgi:hypothetical protein